MTEETSINDLKSLSQSWAERVKSIRQMAKNEDAGSFTEDAAGSSSLNDFEGFAPDEELFAGSLGQTLSAKDIFAGDVEFHESLASARTTAKSDPASLDSSRKRSPKESTVFSKILVAAFVTATFALLSYGVLLNLPLLQNLLSPKNAGAGQSGEQTVAVQDRVANQPQKQQPRFLLDPDHPVSLEVARKYHQEAEYLKACAVYDRLVQDLPGTANKDALKDYLQLSMALCLEQADDHEQSTKLLNQASLSSSPLVRIYANYYLSLQERDTRQFLNERTRAYRAIGLLDIIDIDADWNRQLQKELYFLAAEAITREVLSLADADDELPVKLWPAFDDKNVPLIDLKESELDNALSAGSLELSKALMRPQIQEDDAIEGERDWTVISNAAPMEELMGRFSSNIGRDIVWQTDSENTNVRERPVSLCLLTTSESDVVAVAAGAVGLLASVHEDNSFVICNPSVYSSVAEQISLLSSEAILCWQNYLLKFGQDHSLANAYFALGALKAVQGEFAASISQYKMVSGRYSNSPLGPYALICSSRQKESLHDFQGAYEDLKEAVQQYPDHEGIDQTCLFLAAAAEKMNYNKEAARIYCKVYYLNNSLKSQSDAAFAAGKLFYDDQNYADAEKWLSLYIDLVKDKQAENLNQACLVLGKIWSISNKPKVACEALQVALQGRLSQQDYVETVTALVNSYMAQERFVEAISVLNDTASRQLVPADSVQILLLKSRAFRGVGLTERAIGLLTEREAYVIDDVLKNQIRYELSDCYIERNQMNLAYRTLSKILEETGDTDLGYQVACRLTDVCVRLGMDAQALSVGSQLLNMDPPDAIKNETLRLLAAVYRRQNNYDLAAMVLMGQWK